MLLRQRFESLIILTFCLFLANGFIFAPEVGMGGERFPFHRYLILMEVFLFITNLGRLLPLLQRNIFVLLLPAYMLITSLWAFDPMMVIKQSVFLLITLMLGLQAAVVYIRNTALFTWAIGIFFLLLVIASLFLVYMVPNVGIDTETFGRPRWIGITDHPNKLGVLCMLSIWFGLAILIRTKSNVGKCFAIGTIIMSGLLLVGADSKTSMMASFLLCISAWYILLRNNRAAMILLLFVILTAISLMAFNLDYFTVGNISRISGRDVTTLTGRTHLWRYAVDAFGARPIGGWGFDRLDGLSKHLGAGISHFHNGYLQLAVEGGVVALILFIILAALIFKRLMVIKRVDRKSYAILLSGLAMVLVHNVTESTLMRGLHPLWIVAVLVYFAIGIEAFKFKTEELQKGTAKRNTYDNIISNIAIR